MTNLKVILTILLILFFVSCSTGVNYMGSDKWIGKGGYYVERWYLNPEFDKNEIPIGTKFYGVAADKINEKFIIKYYLVKSDGSDTIQIPTENMWKVKHNGKRYNKQDDDKLFFYTKNNKGLFIKSRAIPTNIKIPVKVCYKNGWCKMYITNSNIYILDETFYVKKSILYQKK